MRGSSAMRKSQQLLKACITEALLVKDRQMSNSLASSSGDMAGIAAQFLQKGGIRNFRTLARAYTDSLLRNGQGKINLEGSKQLAEIQASMRTAARRSYCNKPGDRPAKGFEKYYPRSRKGKPEGQKKGAERKSSKEKSPAEEEIRKVASQQSPLQQALFLGITIAAIAFVTLGMNRQDTQEVSFQWFKANLLTSGLVEKLEVLNKSVVRVYVRPNNSGRKDQEGLQTSIGGAEPTGQRAQLRYHFNVGSVDSFERKLDEAQEDLGWEPAQFIPVTYCSEFSFVSEFTKLLPTILIIAGYVWFTRRSMGGLGGPGGPGGRGLFNVGKAQIAVIDKNAANKTMFKDVAGCNEAKEEVMEFVKFLKTPGKYKELGAKIPKGALLTGPPGTGKTLLAKATAGEAGVPFLSISGSDFMEMFVGVGPARVRDLFAQARTQSPSIIFIDEIDAIGRARGRGGFAGGNDERENTLNQLLVEMDGFATQQGVVVLAGTNRPDILDPALLRPGRFDRQITLDRPDITGREQIFQIHLKKLKLEKGISYFSERMSALTPGFSGADIANVCNEAALIAARAAKDFISLTEFEAAVDRVIGGMEKKNKVISVDERRTVAFHEAGHAVSAWFLRWAEPLLKVSIVPRGSAALGFAQYLPSENLLMSTEQMQDMICMALGGRAAEQLMLGRITTGAQNDLERITQMAYQQVAVYGMSKTVGLVSFPPRDDQFNKPYSNETAVAIDREVRNIVDEAYDRCLKLLASKKDLVEKLALTLLDKEVVNSDALVEILGPRPFKSSELRNIDKFRDGFKKGNEGIGDIETENPESPTTLSPEGKIPGTLDGPGSPHM